MTASLKYSFLLVALVLLSACDSDITHSSSSLKKPEGVAAASPYLVVLGTVQDAGSPQIACRSACCRSLFNHPDPQRKVVSLGLIDPANNRKYLFEATPDIGSQLRQLLYHSVDSAKELPNGIFITHAHIGHYSGLMQLGREATNAQGVNVYALPRLRTFLAQNAPWSQLVQLNNIHLVPIYHDQKVQLSSNVSVKSFTVPHRDEFSETAGFIIQGPNKKVLFIPDIDKWERWERPLVSILEEVDYALIDGTFYSADELPNRTISEIPHPLITETMLLLKNQSARIKRKVYFIHLNHSNPALNKNSTATETIRQNGFSIAQFNQIIAL